MLNQLVLSRAAMGGRIDVHRHASFRCNLVRFLRRFGLAG